ncbi:MAG: iron ABC transporter permease [Bifidobacteriaceae bacterium]|jgi:iron(III) transport system permease protein|nr:iron ABC transporter permease [Bifidobacteriaceae bacterium]
MARADKPRRDRKGRRWPPERVGLTALSLAVAAVIVAPLVVVLVKSLQVQTGLFESTFTFANYQAVFQGVGLTAIGNSFAIGLGSATLATVIGVTLAWFNTRTRFAGQPVFEGLVLVPFFLSPFLGAVAWTYIGSPQVGLLNSLYRLITGSDGHLIDIYSLPGIIWVAGVFHVPLVYLMTSSSFRQMDPALEQASRVSGAGVRTTMLRITVRLAIPSILSAAILTFVLGIEDLATPLILGNMKGIDTLSIEVFEQVQRFPANYNFGAAVGMVLMVIAGAGVLVQHRLLKRRSFVTVTGRGFRPDRLRLGPGGRAFAVVLNALYAIIAVVAPIGTMIAVSVSQGWTGVIDPSRFTLRNYRYLFVENPLAINGIRNSLILATCAATIAIVLSIGTAYGIHRVKVLGARVIEVILNIPVAVPGLVLAVGLLVVLIRSPLYGTLAILMLAYVVRYFPYAQRSVTAALVSISPELEDASRTNGAAWWTTVRKVTFPLLRSGLFGGWLLLFISTIREVSASMLLGRSGTTPMSVALWNFVNYDPIGAAAAYAVIQVGLLLAVAFIMLRIGGKESLRVG